MATTVRVDEKLHRILREISEREQRSIGDVMTEAIEQYRRAKFWEQAKLDYENLRADPEAWSEYQEEIAAWDALSGDGLDPEPAYFTPEEEAAFDDESA